MDGGDGCGLGSEIQRQRDFWRADDPVLGTADARATLGSGDPDWRCLGAAASRTSAGLLHHAKPRPNDHCEGDAWT